MMRRGISGFSVIFIIIVLLLLGYVIYQITKIHFTYGTISELVDDSADMGLAQSDFDIKKNIMAAAKEHDVDIDPDSIIIDHGVSDSFRIYVAYRDSSDIFGVFYYRRHFVVDKIKPIKVRF
jgi:hypothetical protein